MPVPLSPPCTRTGPASTSSPTVIAVLSVSALARVTVIPCLSISTRFASREWTLMRPGSIASAGRASESAAATASAAERKCRLEAQKADMRDVSGFAPLARSHPPQQARAHSDRGHDRHQDGGVRERTPDELEQVGGEALAGDGLARAREPVAQRAQHERAG